MMKKEKETRVQKTVLMFFFVNSYAEKKKRDFSCFTFWAVRLFLGLVLAFRPFLGITICLHSHIPVTIIQWNSDFSNLQGKWELVRKIGSSKNRRWHQITPVLPWYCFIRAKKADNNGISLLLKCEPSLFTKKTCI